MKIDHFMNGESVSSNQTFEKLNPYTSELLYSVSNATSIDLVKAIQFGQKSFMDWKSTKLSDRLTYLTQIKSKYLELKNEIIKAESMDQGLSAAFTETANYNIGLSIIDRFIMELNFQINTPAKNILYSSVGLTVVILSWNLSNRLFIERALAAAMAGNAVIVKCSSQAASIALCWSEILQKIGFPNGVIQFIHGRDQGFKDLLVTHPSIKAISMTGNLKNCSEVLKKTALLSHSQFKKIQLSTGGKNPAISLYDPTEEHAAEVLNSFIIGQGQLAWNSSRLFILEKKSAEWNQLIADYLQKIKPQEGIDDNSVWSPVIKQSSVVVFNELQALAKSDQAKLIQSKFIKQIPEMYLYPTFTKDMSNCSTLQQDQVLAPLYILSEVKYPFDIPKYSNVSYYGFGASIWGQTDKVSKLTDNLDVGHISLNDWFVHSSAAIKAVKQSAYGIQDYRIFGDFFSNVKFLS